MMKRPTLRPKTALWYSLKDLVRAWDLLIGTAQQQLRKKKTQSNGIHNVMLKQARYQNEIIQPGQKLMHDRENENQRKGKRSKTYSSQMKENVNRNHSPDRKIPETQVNLLEEETYKYDLVEVTRELLQVAAADMIKKLISSYRRGDVVAIEHISHQLQELIKDLNLLLGSNSVFLLGSWTKSASDWANSTQERSLLRRNSLYQISLWGPNGEILDYAIKQWNGVMQKYVAPRWATFSEALLSAVRAGIPFDKEEFKTNVFQTAEKPFAEDLDTFYPPSPTGG